MSSAEPIDHDISSEHIVGTMRIQAKDWSSAENDSTAVRFAGHGISRRKVRANRRSKTFRAQRQYKRLEPTKYS
eukprot:7959491-Pyramimonas_sp.AAC.1